MNSKRLGVEVLIIAVLVLALIGLWWFMDRRAGAERAALETEWQARVEAAEAAAEQRASEQARGEAEAVFRAFASGIYPLVLPGRGDALDQAVAGLLELPSVAGVHVIAGDGRVLASSDRKVLTTGRLDDRDAWVLETSEMAVRDGDRAGVLQLAAPVVGPSGPSGFLWLAYDVERARAAG